LKFNGGITAARGHYGANSSGEALISLIRDEATAPQETDVFGCPLCAPAIQAYQATP
jgi:hypothetical protein